MNILQLVPPPEAVNTLTEDEALALTERIRTTTSELWRLLLEAHRREAWRSLGYSSFGAYVNGSFPFGRKHAYRLINQAEVIEALTEAGVAHGSHISERATRGVKPHLAEVVADVNQRVADGEDLDEAVTAALQAARSEGGDKPGRIRPEGTKTKPGFKRRSYGNARAPEAVLATVVDTTLPAQLSILEAIDLDGLDLDGIDDWIDALGHSIRELQGFRTRLGKLATARKENS